MEFDIYNIGGQRKTLEGETLEQTEKAIVIKDKDGDILWWLNPNAIAFINYKKIDNTPHIKLVNE